MRALPLLFLFGSLSAYGAGASIEPACEEINRRVIETFKEDGRAQTMTVPRNLLLQSQDASANGLCKGLTLSNLAALAQRSARPDEAEKYARLSIRELERDPANRPFLVHPLEILAGVYLERGRLGQAKLQLQRLDTFPDLETADRATVNGLWAAIIQKMGHLAEAESKYLSALEDWERGRPSERTRAVPEQVNLARLYIETKRYRQAHILLNRAMVNLTSTPTDHCGEKIQILDGIGTLFILQERAQAAEEPFRSAILLSAGCSTSPSITAQLYRDYAAVLRRSHRKSEARDFDAKAKMLGASQADETVDVAQLSIKSLRQRK